MIQKNNMETETKTSPTIIIIICATGELTLRKLTRPFITSG